MPYVTHVFNTVLTKITFSDVWKKSKITPTSKQNNEFRPISILRFSSKVIENIMSVRINEYVRMMSKYTIELTHVSTIYTLI